MSAGGLKDAARRLGEKAAAVARRLGVGGIFAKLLLISLSGSPGFPRMIPLRMISMIAVIPTIIVISPGRHVRA